MIIRPIAHSDLPALEQIAVESGPGFTSLMDDRDFLRRKIQHSIDSLEKTVTQPGREGYLFVLEDPETGDVIGTTGMEASVGLNTPLYHYYKSREVHQSPELNLFRQVDVLNMCNRYTGCSEVCTLFLRPGFRRAWAGKLLSKVRFLFMAQHSQRFASTVIAEMRGVCDEQGHSPFWNWLREHFIDLDFEAITRLVGAGQNRFIADLMPKYPLYTHLLSPEAQQVIGQVHEKTRPALRLLESEGFQYTGYVDLFDAGPTVEAQVDQVRTVAGSMTCPVEVVHTGGIKGRASLSETNADNADNVMIITNTGTDDFRATITQSAIFEPERHVVQVPADLADALHLENGSNIRFMSMATMKPSQRSHYALLPSRYNFTDEQEFSHAL